uniref:Uncharacterized protein n=1 Tax=Desulfovibrio sp. U5L TaxID=596152 RepID=I2Q1F0_9BACT
MDIKALLAAYAKSKTQYGGTGLLLLALLNVAQSGSPHSFGFAWDGAVYAIPVSLSGLLAAVAVALWGLVLWGRGTAPGPLVDAVALQAAKLEKYARQAKAYEALLAESFVKAQSALATEKPEGATPCVVSPPSS